MTTFRKPRPDTPYACLVHTSSDDSLGDVGMEDAMCSPKYKFSSYTRVHLVGMDRNDVHDAASTNNVRLLRETLESIGDKRITKLMTRISDQSGRTPIHWAAERGSATAVSLLMDYGANVHMADSMGRTPLMLAVGEGKQNVVAAIVNALAKASGRLEVVRAVNGVDITGYSPLALARKRNFHAIADMLTMLGADVASAARLAGIAAKVAARWRAYTSKRSGLRSRADAVKEMIRRQKAAAVRVKEPEHSIGEEVSSPKVRGGIRKQKSIGRTKSVEKASLLRAVSAAAKDLKTILA